MQFVLNMPKKKSGESMLINVTLIFDLRIQGYLDGIILDILNIMIS